MMMNEHFSMKDIMGTFFGLVLFGIGVGAAVIGVWSMYTYNAWIGAFLLLGGGAAALLGARFASMPAQPKMQVPVMGNYLFGLCFIVAVFFLVIGLTTIFSEPLPSIFLMTLAFIGAAVSAWSVVRRSRPG